MSQTSTTSAPGLLFKFIEFIDVKLLKTECGSVNNALHFNNQSRDADIFVRLNKGSFKEMPDIPEGSFYFIPGNRNKLNPSGASHHPAPFNTASVRDRSGDVLYGSAEPPQEENSISYLVFNTTLYHAFPFFSLLELPAFVIPPDKSFEFLISEICSEHDNDKLGREVMLKNYCSELMVRLFRHLNSKPGFEKTINKLQYLTDPRLIGIVEYVRENLEKELTNASLAKIACVSDEYVGQFFKSLTGRTLQDYIEAQRMDRAMQLLQTIPNNIQEIAAMVGFRDAAYFSRRFRMHFNMNANVFRREKSTKPDMNE